MLYLGAICTDPDAMTILRMVKTLITVAKILLPLIIIVTASINFGKVAISGNFDDIKKPAEKLMYSLIAAVIVFFIPTVVNVIFGFVDDRVDVIACFENASLENINLAYVKQADILLVKAEASLDSQDYDEAAYVVNQLENGTTKNNYLARLEKLHTTITGKYKMNYVPRKITTPSTSGNGSTSGSGNTTGSGKLVASGSSSSKGTASMKPGILLSSEPDPSTAINYWKHVKSEDFIYPKDSATGLPLGAWPKNYASIPTQISGYKTYKNTFIFPVTPVGGTYTYVYEHKGIDIMATFGTPIYSPADATMVYSEWGHTVNKGSDETAYTVGLQLSKPVTISGVKVQEIFLTHMSGIRYRCSSGKCNRTVKKGELLGFVGNAAGSATSVGWAPHLHMSLYPKNNYDRGLKTTAIQNDLYGLTSGTSIKVGG